MSIHDHLKQVPTPEIKDLRWAKALELAKVTPHEGRGFNSEAWLDKAKHWGREELKREVYKHLTGEEYESYEMAYFKLFESRLPIVERALDVSSRRVSHCPRMKLSTIATSSARFDRLRALAHPQYPSSPSTATFVWPPRKTGFPPPHCTNRI